MTNDLFTYNEREADIERREARRVAYERVAGQEPVQSVLPDHWGELMAAGQLGLLAQSLVRDRDYYFDRSKGTAPFCTQDTQEIRELSKLAAAALGPVIAEVLKAKERHAALAEEIKGARS